MKYTGITDPEQLKEYYQKLGLMFAFNTVMICGAGSSQARKLAPLLMDKLLRGVVVPNEQTIKYLSATLYEKCWRLIDGRWWMYKSANHNEIFSELFVCKLGQALGMNMAEYERGDKCVKSLDFTNGASVNFEPVASFMGDNEDYEDVANELKTICPKAIPDFVRMIFLDTIVANPDRHTQNFGLLRDTKTGKLLGLAPFFDHNMALISRGYPKAPTKNDLLIKLFNEFIKSNPKYKEYIPMINTIYFRNIIYLESE